MSEWGQSTLIDVAIPNDL